MEKYNSVVNTIGTFVNFIGLTGVVSAMVLFLILFATDRLNIDNKKNLLKLFSAGTVVILIGQFIKEFLMMRF